MKKIIAIVILGIVFALPTFAAKVSGIVVNQPLFEIFKNKGMGGDYQVYKYTDTEAICYVAILGEYKTYPSISCIKK